MCSQLNIIWIKNVKLFKLTINTTLLMYSLGSYTTKILNFRKNNLKKHINRLSINVGAPYLSRTDTPEGTRF